MNFFDMCYDLFLRTSKFHDLGKDIEHYNKAINLMNNFNYIDRTEIEHFIIEVRTDNLIYSVMQQLIRTMENNIMPRTLDQLYPGELYNELCGELYNIVLKGAYDSIKVLNEVSSDQNAELARKFATGDVTIFIQYKIK